MTQEERKIYMKQWRKNNQEREKLYRESRKGYQKEYQKGYKKGYNKIYKQNNKERLNLYQKTRRNTNYLYKLKANIRTLVCISLKRNGFKKVSKTNEILGCSFEFFKNHIETQFLPWMNWDNHGKYNGTEGYGWDIDHKIPLSSATCEEDIIRLNHYSNLQPLCSRMNRDIKKAKY